MIPPPTARTGASRGFTLVELLVVIGIIVLVAAAATPIISTVYRSSQLSHSADVIRTAFQTARQKAITTRTPHRVVFFRLGEDAAAGRYGLRILRFDEDDPAWVGETYVLTAGLQTEESGEDEYVMDCWAYVWPELPSLGDDDLTAPTPSLTWEYQPDGTAVPGAYLEDRPAPIDPDTDRSIYDPESRGVSLSGDAPADIKLVLQGGRHGSWIDVDRSTGRVSVRTAEIQGTLGSMERPAEEDGGGEDGDEEEGGEEGS